MRLTFKREYLLNNVLHWLSLPINPPPPSTYTHTHKHTLSSEDGCILPIRLQLVGYHFLLHMACIGSPAFPVTRKLTEQVEDLYNGSQNIFPRAVGQADVTSTTGSYPDRGLRSSVTTYFVKNHACTHAHAHN